MSGKLRVDTSIQVEEVMEEFRSTEVSLNVVRWAIGCLALVFFAMSFWGNDPVGLIALGGLGVTFFLITLVTPSHKVSGVHHLSFIITLVAFCLSFYVAFIEYDPYRPRGYTYDWFQYYRHMLFTLVLLGGMMIGVVVRFLVASLSSKLLRSRLEGADKQQSKTLAGNAGNI